MGVVVAGGILDQVVDEVGHRLHDLGGRRLFVARAGVGAGGGTGPDGDAPTGLTLAHARTIRRRAPSGVSSGYVPSWVDASAMPSASASWCRPSIISLRYTRDRCVSTVLTDR